MSRIALDTNILAYLAGVARAPEDEAKIARIRGLIRRLAGAAELVVPTQTLGELFVVMKRSGATAQEARAVVLEAAESFTPSASLTQTALAATDLVVDHRLQFWDALILSAAADAGCSMLLSEDMQHGFVARGVIVIDPLREPPHPRLAAALEGE